MEDKSLEPLPDEIAAQALKKKEDNVFMTQDEDAGQLLDAPVD